MHIKRFIFTLFILVCLISNVKCYAELDHSVTDDFKNEGIISSVTDIGPASIYFAKSNGLPPSVACGMFFWQYASFPLEEKNPEFNNIVKAEMRFNGTAVYSSRDEDLRVKQKRNEVMEKTFQKYSVQAEIYFPMLYGNSLYSEPLIVTLISNAKVIDVRFTFKDGKKEIFRVPDSTIQEWREVIKYSGPRYYKPLSNFKDNSTAAFQKLSARSLSMDAVTGTA